MTHAARHPRGLQQARQATCSATPVIAVLLAAWLLVIPAPSEAADAETPSIRVNGEGSVSLAPDIALLSLTVTREGATARQALDDNSAAMAAIQAAMTAAGIAERDLQTGRFSIQPNYLHPGQRAGNPPEAPRIVGYTVRNTLDVRVRELGRLGAILDQAVELGVNEGGQITFSNDDPSAALEQARSAAVKDALGKAETLAAAAGVATGKLLSLSEQSFDRGPVPMAATERYAMAMDSAVPVASGENTYRVVVSLRIAIEQ
jgi:uncharacterized protein YggE